MNIYKLTDPRVKAGKMWGYYLSCVVVAESEEQARLMHPASALDYVKYKWKDTGWKYLVDSSTEWSSTDNWGNPNSLVVELIGKADVSITEPKVIECKFLQ